MEHQHTKTSEQSVTFSSLFLLLVVVAGLCCYANSMGVPFILDDESSITENPVIRSFVNFVPGSPGYTDNPNRYLGNLSFAINYALGEYHPVGYHIVNILIHIINGLLVFYLLRLTFTTPWFTADTDPEQASASFLTPSLLIPAFGSLLFMVHPLQTQAVTYVVQRFTSLAALWYLIALVCYLRWRLHREHGLAFLSAKSLVWYIGTLVAALCAMKTKEIAITLPLAVLLYETCFFGFPRRQRLLELVPILLTIFIIPLSMLTISKSLSELLSDADSLTMVQTTLSRSDYFLTQLRVIVHYLQLTVLPVGQNLDYGTSYPISHSLIEANVLFSALLLLGLLGGGIYSFSKGTLQCSGQNHGELRLVSFGIFWFFLTLSIESSVIPIVDVYFEHRMYLPLVGLSTSVASLVSLGICRWRNKATGIVVGCGIVVVVLMIATVARNQVWRDPIMLWQDVKDKAPQNARAYNNRGVLLNNLQHYTESAREFRGALALNPNYVEAYNNLGLVLYTGGDYRNAVLMYQRAVELRPDYPDGYSNLGVSYIRLGELDNAVQAFAVAASLMPDNGIIRANYARALLQKGRFSEAETELRAVVRLMPDDRKSAYYLQEILRMKQSP